MGTDSKWEYLNRDVGQLCSFNQPLQLLPHNTITAHKAMQHGLIKHRQKFQRRLFCQRSLTSESKLG